MASSSWLLAIVTVPVIRKQSQITMNDGRRTNILSDQRSFIVICDCFLITGTVTMASSQELLAIVISFYPGFKTRQAKVHLFASVSLPELELLVTCGHGQIGRV